MGVTGLWKLIESSGKPVPVETLENKVLAIDISIWLHQVVKGFQDNKGGPLANAHLLGLFHRLCKLLYYRVKPVFIFDGGVPHLKRETIAKRSQSRNKLQTEANRLEDLLLTSLAREKIVQQALGPGAVEALKSPAKQKVPASKPEKDELFKLPAIPEEADEPNTSTSFLTDSTSDTDSSFDDGNLRHSYNHNLQTIDVTSKHFKSLPADVRFDILTDIKETRKQSSWGRLNELPAHRDDFSKFQMKRLLKRRQVQVSLEETEKQMEGKSLTLSELETLLSEEGIVKASESAKRVASNEHTRFLLVKDLKKAMETARRDGEASCSQESITEEAEVDDEDILGEEYDDDLQKAIEMSLQSTVVYKDSDYGCDDQVKLNEVQRQELKSAANSLARAYMIEYGGMNDDDIKNMVDDDEEVTESDTGKDLQSSFNFKHNDRFIVNGEICTPHKPMKSTEEQPENKGTEDPIHYISSSSDNDSDFEEVTAITNSTSRATETKTSPNLSLEIVVDTKKEAIEEDLFADIFQNESLEVTPNSSTAAVDLVTCDLTASQLDSAATILGQEKIPPPLETKDLSLTLVKSDPKDSSLISIKTDTKDTLIPSCSKIAVNILAKLREEIKQVSNITLEQLDVDCKIPGMLSKTETSPKLEDVDELPKIDDASATKKEDASNLEEILENVRKQTAEISKIRLENIAVVASNIVEIDDSDISDSEKAPSPKKSPVQSNEIIEIPDDPILGLKTPTKPKAQTSIGNFFETQFTVKRTPEKPPEEDAAHTPKVKSPFFVNKSPRSGGSGRKRKSPTSAHDGSGKSSKVSKQLFEKLDETENDIEPFNALEAAAKILRENKSQDELLGLASELSKDKRELEAERNRQNRMGTSITDKMSSDCMRLLRLFGIPYIVAPMEAEAQCAFLDAMKLTDGTITDDSDIWLFGGRTVYKNFFNQKKLVVEFKIDSIEQLFHVDRQKLIQLAILVGSDYTTGISGIGAVTALEILATFPITPVKENETTENMSVLSSLRKFRDWWSGGKIVGPGGRTTLRNKLKNIELYEGFPNLNIVDAYLHPTVDDNQERFTWGNPDVETIREYTKKTFGWTKSKTDDILQPVLKRMNERKSQASIKNYFTVKSSTAGCNLKVSKRVQKAIDKMSSDYVEDCDTPTKPKVRKTPKKSSCVETPTDDCKAAGPSRKARLRRAKGDTDTNQIQQADAELPGPPKKITKKTPNIPNTKQIIPQKEKTKKEMELKKEKAIEIFKKSQVD